MTLFYMSNNARRAQPLILSGAKALPDLCIDNGTILNMDPVGAIIADGALLIEGSRIAFCGPRRPDAPGCHRLEALGRPPRGGLILPGLVNGNIHGAMTLFRGLADDLALDTHPAGRRRDAAGRHHHCLRRLFLHGLRR